MKFLFSASCCFYFIPQISEWNCRLWFLQGGDAVWCIGFQKIQGQGVTILGGIFAEQNVLIDWNILSLDLYEFWDFWKACNFQKVLIETISYL